MSIRKRGKAYQVRVTPYPSKTVRTREDAEKLEIDLKRRKSLGALYEAPPITLGAAIDGTLKRVEATRDLRAKTLDYNRQCAKFWTPMRSIPLGALSRVAIEDAIIERALKHPRSAKNELEFLKRVLRDEKGRGQRFDESILTIPSVRHRARKGRALTVTELHDFASWFPDSLCTLPLLVGQIGCRQRVWFNLTDDLLDLDLGTMTIPEHLAKNGLEHCIFLTDLEVGLFREQLERRPKGTVLSSRPPKAASGRLTDSAIEYGSRPSRQPRCTIRTARTSDRPSSKGSRSTSCDTPQAPSWRSPVWIPLSQPTGSNTTTAEPSSSSSTATSTPARSETKPAA